MSTHTKYHLKAMRNSLELCIIGGLVALVGDLGWLLHDIIVNGLSIWYGCVGFALIVGIILTALALQDHHTNNFKEIIKNVLEEKLNLVKCKNRNRRNKEA